MTRSTVLLLTCLVLPPLAATHASELEPRTPLAKSEARLDPVPGSSLLVKFRDELRVRAAGGRVVSTTGAMLTEADAITRRHGLEYSRWIGLPLAEIELLEQRAAARSGVAQPDLAGIVEVHGPPQALALAARELHALDSVEWVEFARLSSTPPCADVPPPTPDYFGLQTHHGPNPGIDMEYLWSLGYRGQGVQVADVEKCFLPDHEDLCGIVTNQQPGCDDSVDHGTAVLGILVALDNGYGATGLVPEATGHFYAGDDTAAAIAASAAGDVVLLEQQTILGEPAELHLSTWTLTRTATDAGVIVVAAAGNGNNDLDGPGYAEYRNRGDSGAIIVGAGSSDLQHDKLSYSSYGSRVDVQGWGENVFTTSTFQGGFNPDPDDPRQGYRYFSGTSAASPVVAGAVVGLQSLAEQVHGCRLEPRTMRQLLIDTGIPQGAGGPIGPLPDLKTASQVLLGLPGCPDCGNGVLEYGEACEGSDLGAATCGDAGCTAGAPVCLASCDVDYTPCGCCDGLVIRPASAGGGFSFPERAYDGSDASYAVAEPSQGLPIEHLFQFPPRGVRSGQLRAKIGAPRPLNQNPAPGEITALYSTDGGASFTELGSTTAVMETFTVDLLDADLAQLQLHVEGVLLEGGGKHSQSNATLVGVFEVDFTEDPPAGCECATAEHCPDDSFCTAPSCDGSFCVGDPVCQPGELCDEELELCIDDCPGALQCDAASSGCRKVIPPSCGATDTGEPACLLPGGEPHYCPTGETVHTYGCACEAFIQGSFCPNQSQTWYCSD